MQWDIVGGVISDKGKWKQQHFSTLIYPSTQVSCTVPKASILGNQATHCKGCTRLYLTQLF